MLEWVILSVCGTLILFGLASERAKRAWLTGPMVFLVAGALIGPHVLDLFALEISHALIHGLAEITLALLLFTDAARFDLKALRREARLPARMLFIGLPLAIVCGGLTGWLLFPELGLGGALVLAAVLAPTDAALGQAVIDNEEVPRQIRQTIGVESGLNDGLVVPFLMLLAVFAGAHLETTGGSWSSLALFALQQVGLGVAVGLAMGFGGGWIMRQADERDWMEPRFEHLVGLSLALVALALSETVGGNGFIAAFFGGLAFGHQAQAIESFIDRFLDGEAHLLALLVFFAVGFAYLTPGIARGGVRVWIYAALSLTVVRGLPIALSLIGSGLRWPSRLFLGWFGPRGLASLIFAIVVHDMSDLPHRELIFDTALCVVLVSVFAHGLSATPLAHIYGRYTSELPEDATEHEETSAPVRGSASETTFPSAPSKEATGEG